MGGQGKKLGANIRKGRGREWGSRWKREKSGCQNGSAGGTPAVKLLAQELQPQPADSSCFLAWLPHDLEYTQHGHAQM